MEVYGKTITGLGPFSDLLNQIRFILSPLPGVCSSWHTAQTLVRRRSILYTLFVNIPFLGSYALTHLRLMEFPILINWTNTVCWGVTFNDIQVLKEHSLGKQFRT